MAQTKYTYSIANDTLNGAVYLTTLKAEIQSSAILIAYDYGQKFGDVLDLYFKDALSAGDQTILDGIVAAHTGVIPDDVIKYQEFLTQAPLKTKWTGKNMLFTKDSETHLYVPLPFTYIRGGKLELQNHQFGKDDFDLQIVIKGASHAEDTIVDDYLTEIPVPLNGCLEVKSNAISNPMAPGLQLRATYRSATGAIQDVLAGLTLYGKNDV